MYKIINPFFQTVHWNVETTIYTFSVNPTFWPRQHKSQYNILYPYTVTLTWPPIHSTRLFYMYFSSYLFRKLKYENVVVITHLKEFTSRAIIQNVLKDRITQRTWHTELPWVEP